MSKNRSTRFKTFLRPIILIEVGVSFLSTDPSLSANLQFQDAPSAGKETCAAPDSSGPTTTSLALFNSSRLAHLQPWNAVCLCLIGAVSDALLAVTL